MSNKENNPQNKVRMCITVSKEIHEWIAKTRGNASRIAEQAYLALKKEMEMTYGTDALIIKLAQNKEWTRRELNSRPLQCQFCSNSSQNGKQSENIGYFENSGKTVEVAFLLDKYGSILC